MVRMLRCPFGVFRFCILAVAAAGAAGCNSGVVDVNVDTPATLTSVTSALVANISSSSLTPSASQAFTVTGGKPPYSWSVTSGTGTLTLYTGAATSFSSATSQIAEVTVSDSGTGIVHIPVRVSQTLTKVTHGGWNGCAVMSTGGVKCWGYDLDGRIGDGGTTSASSPVSVPALASGVIAVAYANIGCAVMGTYKVDCWGNNYYGSMGNGTSGFVMVAPTEVPGVINAVEVGIGSYNVCVRLLTGDVQCWGVNTYGQVGDGTIVQRNTPYTVLTGTATQIAVGPQHACALLSDHTIKCWGRNYTGELGNGTLVDSSTPVVVTGITTATQVAVGKSHTCALLANATMTCWGRADSGQLGNGSFTTLQTAPGAISGLTGVTLIAAGGDNTCALAGTTLKCWGDQECGAAGSGAAANGGTPFSTPQTVSNIGGGTTAIAIGGSSWGSTLIAIVNGQAYTWGLNDNLQLGNGGSAANQLAPALTSPF